jgi:hypothetical protein
MDLARHGNTRQTRNPLRPGQPGGIAFPNPFISIRLICGFRNRAQGTDFDLPAFTLHNSNHFTASTQYT